MRLRLLKEDLVVSQNRNKVYLIVGPRESQPRAATEGRPYRVTPSHLSMVGSHLQRDVRPTGFPALADCRRSLVVSELAVVQRHSLLVLHREVSSLTDRCVGLCYARRTSACRNPRSRPDPSERKPLSARFEWRGTRYSHHVRRRRPSVRQLSPDPCC